MVSANISPNDLVTVNTPWEKYDDIWVKREDLSCPNGPKFSKIRGVYERLIKQTPGTTVGVLDTVHSKGGWGVAYICKALGLPCVVFYPGIVPRAGQIKAQELGAQLISLKPGRSTVLWYQARSALSKMAEQPFMMPNGLQLEESIEATKQEVELSPPELLEGTWIVSVSTGTIAKGVYQGLAGRAKMIAHMGYSRSTENMLANFGPGVLVIDEDYKYKDAVDYPCPFPCNPYYDLKAWKWLKEKAVGLAPPVIFWNIGD